MNFHEAWKQTMSWEGHGVTHKVEGDPGGDTRYGISERAHPDVDLHKLTEGSARAIAKVMYWNRLRCYQLPDLLQFQVFDTGYNCGPSTAARILQLAINVELCSLAPPDEILLKVDGVLGRATVAAAAAHSPSRVCRIFKALRAANYLRLADERPGSAKFIHGWLRRAEGGYNG